MFRNLSLRSRFLVAPILGVVLMLIMYFASNLVLRSNSDLFQKLSDTNLPRVSKLTRLTLLLTNNHNRLTDVLIANGASGEEEKIYTEGRVILNAFFEIEADFVDTYGIDDSMDADQQEIVGKIRSELIEYRNILISSVEISTVSANLARTELLLANKVILDVSDHLLQLSDYYVERLSTESDLINNSIEDYRIVNVVALFLIFLMIFMALYFSSRMSLGLGAINRALLDLSKGKTEIILPKTADKYIGPLTTAV